MYSTSDDIWVEDYNPNQQKSLLTTVHSKGDRKQNAWCQS